MKASPSDVAEAPTAEIQALRFCRSWLTLLVLALVFFSGCATTNVAPLGEAVGADSIEVDERYLWEISAEAERDLDRSGLRFQDPELMEYVNGVALNLVGSQFSRAGMTPSVRILSQVDMNAFAFSNGVVYLHTAMLSRMENEAQLATLLGHEFAHVIARDILRQHRDLKNKTALMSGMAIAFSAAPVVQGIDIGGLVNWLFQLSMVSSIYGFSRGIESEADRTGLEYMVKAGYDANEAPKLFEIMVAYQDELEEQGIERDSEPFFFSSHPKMKGRIKSYGKLIRDFDQSTVADHSGVRNEKTFRDRVEAVVVHQAQLEIDAGRYRSAEITVRRALQRNPDNALAWAVLGEALQSQDHGQWSAESIDAYRRSLAGADENPRAHRALGMAFFKRWSGDSRQFDDATKALHHFERFVELSPNAPDRGYVDAYMREIRPAVSEPPPPEESP